MARVLLHLRRLMDAASTKTGRLRVSERGMLRPHYGKLVLAFRAFEAFLVVTAFVEAWLLDRQPLFPVHALAAVAGAAGYVVVAQSRGLYGSWRGVPLRQHVSGVLTAWAVVVLGLLVVALVSRSLDSFSRVQVGVWLVLAPAQLAASRVVVGLALRELRQNGYNTRRVAFAGVSGVAEHVARAILEAPWSGMRIAGFYDDRLPGGAADAASAAGTAHARGPATSGRGHRIPEEVGAFRGTFDRLLEDARAGKLDVVYISLPLRADVRIQELIERLADTTVSVHVIADSFVSSLLQARWTSVGDVPVLSVRESPFNGPNALIKRAEDVVLGTMILAIIAVPMAMVALAVKLTSRGPVLFRQRRYGLAGEEIVVLKFRSMSVCEDGPVVTQATKADPRLTPIGAFLRRTSLDELPQFLNVLTGEMSIVGPRPHAVAHNELYRSKIHGYMLRHKVKPGITGWAQVNGWRGETDTLEKMEQRVTHDLDYIRNWGLLFDLKIILLTVFGRAARANAR